MTVKEQAGRLIRRATDAVGGTARARVVLVLGGVLALDGADKGTISTMAGPLEHTFSVGNTAIGLLVSVVSLASAAATIPVGLLTDRTRRTRLLAVSIALWAAAMLIAGAAPSYTWLLISRAALGAVSATAGPTVASLVGDFFPLKDRARMYGFVLGGELVGTGLGFAVSGLVGSALGWRYAFWWLVVPGAALAWIVGHVAEPARGGQSRIRPGQERILDARDAAPPGGHERSGPSRDDADLAGLAARRARVEPDDRLVLRSDPREAPTWWTIRYVLRVRTNLVLILASSLGYFYFTGLRSFATLFATQRYGISVSTAGSLVLVVGIGALAGVLTGGRLSDRLLERGRVNARTLVPTVSLLTVPFLLAPAVHSTTLAVALPLLVIGTLALGAANPPLDAARLDILPPYLWGTGEGVRTMLRTLCEAAAPALFGYVSAHVFSGGPSGAGLEYTLLVFLVALLAAGLLGLVAMRTYPQDVATAEASEREIRRRQGTEDAPG